MVNPQVSVQGRTCPAAGSAVSREPSAVSPFRVRLILIQMVPDLEWSGLEWLQRAPLPKATPFLGQLIPNDGWEPGYVVPAILAQHGTTQMHWVACRVSGGWWTYILVHLLSQPSPASFPFLPHVLISRVLPVNILHTKLHLRVCLWRTQPATTPAHCHLKYGTPS